MGSPRAYTPKKREQYTSSEESALYYYFAETLGWGEGLHSRITFDFLMEVRSFASGKTILDAGAGHKRFQQFFSKSEYLTVEHPSGIEMKAMQGITYDYLAELDGSMFRDEQSLHAIYSHSVLEHIERPERFFANAFRMLQPGGRLFIHCPFMYPEHETPYDFNRFSRYGLSSRLKETGFNIIKILPSSNAFYGVSAFFLQSIAQDGANRGFRIENYTMPDGSKIELMSILNSIISTLNTTFDDCLYDNDSPIGWICVAERP